MNDGRLASRSKRNRQWFLRTLPKGGRRLTPSPQQPHSVQKRKNFFSGDAHRFPRKSDLAFFFFFLFRRKWLRRQNVHRKEKIVSLLSFLSEECRNFFPESHSDLSCFPEENGRKQRQQLPPCFSQNSHTEKANKQQM